MDPSSFPSILASRLLELTNTSIKLLSCRCRTLQTSSEYDGLSRELSSGCIVHIAIVVPKRMSELCRRLGQDFGFLIRSCYAMSQRILGQVDSFLSNVATLADNSHVIRIMNTFKPRACSRETQENFPAFCQDFLVQAWSLNVSELMNAAISQTPPYIQTITHTCSI